MLLEVYILFQISAFIGLFLTLYTDGESLLPSLITLLISGILAVGAWVLNIGINYVWNPDINAYIAEVNTVNTPYLAIFNIAIFGLALVYFLWDTFKTASNSSPEVKNVVTGKGEGLNKWDE